MRPESAQVKYQQADKLFRENQYAAALEILTELDQAFPKTKNVMLLKAFCLAYLYRAQEAIRVCDRILGRFECPEAHDLKIRLVKNDGLPVMPGRDTGPPRKMDSSSNSQFRRHPLKDMGDAFGTVLILLAAALMIGASIHYILHG